MTHPALRRVMHAASAALLLVVPLASWDVFRVTVFALAGCAVVVEGARLAVPVFRRALGRAVPVFRAREDTRPSGAMWLAVGYALAALTPAPAPAAGILVAAFADPAASLVGTWRRGAGRKTWRGTAAHAVVATVILTVLGWSLPAVVGGALVASVLERWSAGVDDNLVVAPVTALVVFAIG